MRMILIAAMALALAGCQKAPEQNAASVEANDVATTGSEGNVLVRVLAMSDRERNVVLIRALIDAKLPCDGVKSSTRVTDAKGPPMWKVECVNGSNHLVAITPDGTATVFSRPN